MADSAFGDSTGMLLGLFTGAYGLFAMVMVILYLVGLWKIFEKANQPGWASLIPIYNIIVLLKIVGRPWWWILLLLIPIVNFVIAIIVTWDLSKAFGHGFGFFLGLVLLGWLFYIILGWGGSKYVGSAA